MQSNSSSPTWIQVSMVDLQNHVPVPFAFSDGEDPVSFPLLSTSNSSLDLALPPPHTLPSLNHKMNKFRRDLWKPSRPSPLHKTGSAIAGCSRCCPLGFLVSSNIASVTIFNDLRHFSFTFYAIFRASFCL